jgi:hypothetical protein
LSFSISDSAGFTFLNRGDSSIGAITRTQNPHDSGSRSLAFGPTERNDQRLAELVKKSVIAYTVDGLVRQSVDKYTELFAGFRLDGAPEVVAYLTKRLSEISLSTGETWQGLFSRAIHEYFKTGNAFLLKVRGGSKLSSMRPLYDNRPYSLSGLFVVSAARLSPHRDKSTGRFVGWKFDRATAPVNLVSPRALKLDPSHALISMEDPEDEGVFCVGPDIVHIAYKRGADSLWGVGLAAPALEDVSLLRTIEQSVAVLIKKYSNPIIHHRVLRPANPLMGIQNEINMALQLHQRMGPEGVIVTGGQHEIKAVGSESQALRLEGYLKHFSNRVFSGLGVSPYIMGFEGATLGTAEAANELLMTRTRYCQREIARELEMFVINEILWEGGFDPFNNPNHRVKLEFEDLDQNRIIKMQNHYADLYAKDVLGLQEARVLSGFKPRIDEKDTYLNRVTIPTIKAKGEASQPFQPSGDAQDGADSAGRTRSGRRGMAADDPDGGPPDASAGKSAGFGREPARPIKDRKAAESLFESVIPTSADEVPNFIRVLSEACGLPSVQVEEYAQDLEVLVGDDAAILEFALVLWEKSYDHRRDH